MKTKSTIQNKYVLMTLIMFIISGMFNSVWSQVTYTTLTNGSWNSSLTWVSGLIPTGTTDNNVNIGHTVTKNSGFTIGSSSTLNINSTGNLDIDGDLSISNNRILNVHGKLSVDNLISQGSVTVSGSDAELHIRGEYLPSNGKNISIENGAKVIIDSDLDGRGNIAVDSTAKLLVKGSVELYNNRVFSINDTVIIDGNLTSSGAINIGPNGVLIIRGNLTNNGSGVLNNKGTILIEGNFTNSGNISVDNSGSMTVGGNTDNTGNLGINSTGDVTFNGTVDNSGSVDINSTGSITFNDEINNSGSSTIDNYGVVYITDPSQLDINNYGTFIVDNDSIDVGVISSIRMLTLKDDNKVGVMATSLTYGGNMIVYRTFNTVSLIEFIVMPGSDTLKFHRHAGSIGDSIIIESNRLDSVNLFEINMNNPFSLNVDANLNIHELFNINSDVTLYIPSANSDGYVADTAKYYVSSNSRFNIIPVDSIYFKSDVTNNGVMNVHGKAYFSTCKVENNNKMWVTDKLQINSTTNFSGGINSRFVLKNMMCLSSNVNLENSIVELNGSDSSFVFSSQPITVGKLLINKEFYAGIHMNSNIIVLDSLIFEKPGRLITGNDTLIISNPNPGVVRGNGKLSFVEGNVRRNIGATGTYIFPVGCGTVGREARVILDASNGIDALNINYKSSVEGRGKLNVDTEGSYDSIVSGKWVIEPILNGSTYDITYDIQLSLEGVNNLEDYFFGILKRSSDSTSASSWMAVGDLPDTNEFGRKVADEYAVRKGLTSFSEFGIGVFGITMDFKVNLAGPFDLSSAKMNTTLRSNNLLPLIQPYSASPWNYSGNESVDNINKISATAVDWVLISFRTGTAASTTVHQLAGMLFSDGYIRNPDSTKLHIQIDNTQQYFIVVYHRNHLSVMTSTPVFVDDKNSYQWDFTGGQAYGHTPQKELDSGKFGMYPGDINGDGNINASDFPLWYNNKNTNQYHGADLDLDGNINATDESIWQIHNGTSTRVP